MTLVSISRRLLLTFVENKISHRLTHHPVLAALSSLLSTTEHEVDWPQICGRMKPYAFAKEKKQNKTQKFSFHLIFLRAPLLSSIKVIAPII